MNIINIKEIHRLNSPDISNTSLDVLTSSAEVWIPKAQFSLPISIPPTVGRKERVSPLWPESRDGVASEQSSEPAGHRAEQVCQRAEQVTEKVSKLCLCRGDTAKDH